MSCSKLVSGVPITDQAREIVFNVLQFCQEEKDHQACTPLDRMNSHGHLVPLARVHRRVSCLTGVSERTVARIASEGKAGGFNTPTKRATWHSVVDSIDTFTVAAIKQVLHNMYQRGEHVTLDTLLTRVVENVQVNLSRSSLRKVLLRNGYRFRKVDRRRILMEKPAVVAARARFLRAMKRVRSEESHRPIIYLDETWFNQHDYQEKAWLDETEFSGRKAVIGKGKRLVIVHAGSEAGFISNALLTFWSDGKLRDYHDSMNAECFEQWFSALTQKVPPRSLIVMDNASYHSRQLYKPPTTSTKKDDIKTWLKENHIAFDEDMLKVELLQLVKQHQRAPVYVVDEMAKQRGHEVLRLAPYNCDLNPIELIWAQVKGYVRQHNKTGQMSSIQDLVAAAVDQVTPSMWASCCDHVSKTEEMYWKSDCIMDEIDPFVIGLGSDDSDSDSDDSDE